MLAGVSLAVSRLAHPAAQDELLELVASLAIFNGGPYTMPGWGTALDLQPHLFQFLHVVSFKLLGPGEISARASGVFVYALSVLAVFFSVLKLGAGEAAANRKAALTAACLFSVMPLAVQGGLNLHPDAGLLVLLLLVSFFCFSRLYQDRGPAWGAIFSVSLGLLFWVRLASPALSAAALSLFAFFGRGRAAGLKSSAWAAAGALLFLASWGLYCSAHGVDFYGPFRYLCGAFAARVPGTPLELIRQPAESLVYVLLWTGTAGGALLAAHALSAAGEIPKRPWPLEFAYLYLGSFLVAGYLFVGGNTFGFPKYQAPGLALLCVFLGLRLARAGLFPSLKHAALLIAVCAFLSAVVWGDALYFLRYRLRELLAAGSGVMPEAALLGARSLVFAGAVFWLLSKFGRIYSKAVYSVLPAAAIGTALGLSVLQSFAGYQTNYAYGAEKTAAAAEYVKSAVPEGAGVLAVSDILRLLGRPPAEYVDDSVWNDRNRLLEAVRNPGTAAVVYSAATNTVRQVRTLETDPEISSELEKKFKKSRVGTAVIWLRPAGRK